MYEDTVVSFAHPDRISTEDPLTEVLRLGARRLLAEAIEAEVSAFIADYADLVDEAGRRRVVRHGYLPEREVQKASPMPICVHTTVAELGQMFRSEQLENMARGSTYAGDRLRKCH